MPKKKKPNARYWTEFCDYLRQRSSQFHPLGKPNDNHYHFQDFLIEIPGFAVKFAVRARQVVRPRREISVSFIIRHREVPACFDGLKEQKVEIENEFGESLSADGWWIERSHEIRVAALIKKDTDPTDENDWSHQHEWMATKLEKLHAVFCPRIEKLDNVRFD